MSSGRDEGPVYYREIQKNNYLKRIPSESTSGKLIPISHKKPPLKPMWTLFCVHNGRTPFLEQYPEPDSPLTLTHKPVWRACLKTARHVTASVKPHVGDEYDFLIDTDHGPVRMLAPDWDSMQDWVGTLRNKLHELKILSKGENVYCAPPAAPPARAGTRDPTSPLPPTPPVPPDRVPGIELNPTRPATTEPQLESETETPPIPIDTPDINTHTELSNTPEDVDISNWDTPFSSLPSTSTQEPKMEPKSVTKICGQNICLDDSILKRNVEVTDSDEEFFAEIDRIHSSVENLVLDGVKEYKQRVVVSDEKTNSSNSLSGNQSDQYHSTNITVIEVSNKGPPHTAIPVLGSETDVFNFDLTENDRNQTNFVNIVNTEDHKSTDNRYGAIFLKDSEYDHLSLTTTVKVSDVKTDGLYERLCMASTSKTSNTEASPLPVKKLKTLEKSRKSSLPNLETESTYEYLFPNSSQNNNERNVTVNSDRENSNVTEAPCITRVTNGPVNPRIENPRPLETTTNAAPSIRSQVTNSLSMAGISDARVRSQVERSHSQNAYDSTPRLRDHLIRRVQNNSPKRDVKNGDKTECTPAKPIWKRGLTELSLLSKLRGIGQAKRQDSPTRQESNGVNGASNRGHVTSPVQVMHRSRPEARVDTARRRSNSLSNGHAPAAAAAGGLQSLRQRQAAALRAEQARGAALAASIPASDPPVFADYDKQVWVSRWSRGARCAGRAGDRVAALRGVAPRDAHHARQLVKTSHTHLVDILFHRVPLGKIYVLIKWDHENLGIKLDGECNIVSVDGQSAAARAGLVPPGKWALTEVNNRPLNLVKGGEEEMNRLSMHGNEVSVLIQPSALVKKLRAALKSRPLLSR